MMACIRVLLGPLFSGERPKHGVCAWQSQSFLRAKTRNSSKGEEGGRGARPKLYPSFAARVAWGLVSPWSCMSENAEMCFVCFSSRDRVARVARRSYIRGFSPFVWRESDSANEQKGLKGRLETLERHEGSTFRSPALHPPYAFAGVRQQVTAVVDAREMATRAFKRTNARAKH